MKKVWHRIATMFGRGAGIWTSNLVLLAVAVFVNRFGQGLFGGVRTNFFVDTLGITGGQVLALEGIREIPGLALMFIAAFTMRLPLSRRASVSVVIMGVGYALFALVNSYAALLAVAVAASLGMHMWMPLNSSLGMCLSQKDKTGRTLGTLNSVGALASLAGMGVLSLIAIIFQDVPLRAYYVAGAVFIGIAAALLWRIPTGVGETAQEQPRMLLDKRYWLYYVLTFFQGSRKEVLNSFGTLVLVDTFDFEVWQISTLLLVSSVVNLLAGPYLGALIDRFGERKTVTTSYIVLILGCMGFVFIGNPWVLAAVLIVIKLAALLEMGVSMYVHKIAPSEELTPTLSAGISINHITSVLMPLVAGALMPLIGYEGIFVMAAGLIVLSVPFAVSLKVTPPPMLQPEPVGAE
ncbi:MAG: MFS transporter [Anaerolineae bacterium]|nr:MFS transporter [Anaerolineae bacterium]